MRSLYWRILASFWLALVLVAGLAWLVGRVLNQDALILSHYPAVKGLPERWVQVYEAQGPDAAQGVLEHQRQSFRVDVQVFDLNGLPLVTGTFPPGNPAWRHLFPRLAPKGPPPWRRLATEYRSPLSGISYWFVFRIPLQDLAAWSHSRGIGLTIFCIALAVLTLFSLWLTRSITRPLDRLRGAVHDLGQTAYQQTSLAQLALRRDELGALARDFNHMGSRLQGLLSSQRQLLRDVSHELRSPLARLRIAIALAERADHTERQRLWPRLVRECDRLDTLIDRILVLARLDAEPGAPMPVDLNHLLGKIREDAKLAAPEQQLLIPSGKPPPLLGWPDMLADALDNLIRNALRFNPVGSPIEVRVATEAHCIRISVRDHGPGVATKHLPQLGKPFYRAAEQSTPGYGLGLAIARRAAQRHGGELRLENHPEQGFLATLVLPLEAKTDS